MTAPDQGPLPCDPVAVAVLRSELLSPRSAAFPSGDARPAILLRTTATRSALLGEMPDAGVRKNVCNQAALPRRNLLPHSAARDFAKYETAAGLPLSLLSRAIAKAPGARRPRDPAAKQIRGCAKGRP